MIDILLIEEETDLRIEIAEYLSRRGYRVTSCANIAEAQAGLDFIGAKSPSPCIVLSDMSLPDGNGATFYVDNAKRFPATRWILMSGNHDLVRAGSQLSERHDNDFPGCAVIDKPIPLRLLDRFIQNTSVTGQLRPATQFH